MDKKLSKLFRKVSTFLEEQGFYSQEFNLGNYAENAVCLVPADQNMFEVFYGERNFKYNLQRFPALEDAFDYFISQLTYDEPLQHNLVMTIQFMIKAQDEKPPIQVTNANRRLEAASV